jgi:hypothetical protein
LKCQKKSETKFRAYIWAFYVCIQSFDEKEYFYGLCWLAGEPVALELAGDHGHEGGVVVGEQHVVAGFRVSFQQHLVPCVEAGEH